ncbi:MAG: hypothetical protein QOC71_792 [Thermoplasmata archaeon]|nr:hypothetical protein [Thermoplasmata archaeon]
MKAIPAALIFALAFAGCLSQLQGEGDPAHRTAACSLLGHPDQVPLEAPAEAGPGHRQVDVTVLGADSQPAGHMAVVAWWQPTRGDVHVLQLMSDEAGKAVLHVPDDEAVDLMAGRVEWTHEAHLDAGAESAALTLTPASLLGVIAGEWTEALAEGVSGAVWQPNDLPWADAGHMDRLEGLDLTLLWDNGPQGGADFGIGVGPNGGSGFHYTNRQYQTTVGPQSEERTLGAADFEQLGWDNTTLPQAGPSISTGGFAVASIPYTLMWEATFATDPALPDRCLSLGDTGAVDDTDSRSEAPGSATVSATFGPRRAGRVD